MSGDIEEFLRRAAERRQQAARQRAAQQQKQQASSRPRPAPQYTDRAAERRAVVAAAEEPDEVTVVAEIVEPVASAIGGLAQRSEARRAAKQVADARHAVTAQPVPESLIQALTQQLATADGLRLAVLLREVIDRPTHRW